MNLIRSGAILPDQKDLCGDCSSEESADEDQAEHAESEEAVGAVAGQWTGDVDPDILPQTPEWYCRHCVSRVMNFIADESGMALTCRRLTTKSH